MKYLRLKSTDPYLNLAIEEYLFRNSKDDIFMLWQNEPTVVIGRNQNAYAELDLDFIRREGIKISRRITGGGAVYHDLGNVNYTYISSGAALDFARLSSPIIEALRECGLPVLLSGRNDIELAGRKFSGNAEHSEGGRVLHHGTLLFDTDITVLSRALLPDRDKLAARGVRSVRSRVDNLAPHLEGVGGVEDFILLLENYILREHAPELTTYTPCEEIEALRERNASREWLFPERDFLSGYSMEKKRRYPFGTVCISLDMLGEKIRAVRITGDFFGVRKITELEELLSGADISGARDIIALVPVGEYIHGMTKEELGALLE